MQSQWIYEFISPAHAPRGDPRRNPRNVIGRIWSGERKSDPLEMKNDFRSHVGFRQSPLTSYKYSFVEKSSLHFALLPFCVRSGAPSRVSWVGLLFLIVGSFWVTREFSPPPPPPPPPPVKKARLYRKDPQIRIKVSLPAKPETAPHLHARKTRKAKRKFPITRKGFRRKLKGTNARPRAIKNE